MASALGQPLSFENLSAQTIRRMRATGFEYTCCKIKISTCWRTRDGAQANALPRSIASRPAFGRASSRVR